ncbi:MAG: VWA domain-containing protein [Alistipes sp.]|jgi:Ca-activated chloride channel family protein|nr:VWA domain-containing protein [Alistipes sp.]
MFRFAHPEYFWLLLALPLMTVVYGWSVYRRRRRLERFADAATLPPLIPDASPVRHFTKFVLLMSALALMVVALARPQLGSKLKEVTISGIELMLAVDVSNSMLASDFEPNRLERTKNAIGRLLEGLKQDRVGLVVFAGDAYVQLPITSDYTTAMGFVRQITPTMVSRQGTAIGAAIDLAVSGFSSDSISSRAIILITDGENHEDDAIAAAQRAAAKGIKIYTIGIGTPEGAPIRVGDDFLRDEAGEMVVSHLDETGLQRIALTTGGAYIRSSNQSVGLTEIIAKINETEKHEFRAQMFDEYDEQYGYFLGAGLVCLVLGWALVARRSRILARFNIFRKE